MRRRATLALLLGLAGEAARAAPPPRRRRSAPPAPPPEPDEVQPDPPPAEHKAEVTAPAYDPAPMPDQDAASPGTQATSNEGLAPAVIRRPQTFRGDAFSAGDSVANSQARNQKPVVGFSVTTPMQ